MILMKNSELSDDDNCNFGDFKEEAKEFKEYKEFILRKFQDILPALEETDIEDINIKYLMQFHQFIFYFNSLEMPLNDKEWRKQACFINRVATHLSTSWSPEDTKQPGAILATLYENSEDKMDFFQRLIIFSYWNNRFSSLDTFRKHHFRKPGA